MSSFMGLGSWVRWTVSPRVAWARKKRGRLAWLPARGKARGRDGRSGRGEQGQRARHGQAHDVVEAALLERRHEALGVLLDRVAAGLVAPLARLDVGRDLGRRERTHAHPG